MSGAILTTLSATVPVTLCMIVGAIYSKAGSVDIKALNKFVFQLALPCVFLHALMPVDWAEVSFSFLLGCIIFKFVALIISITVSRFFMKRENFYRNVAVLFDTLAWLNAVIIGFPVIEVVFGKDYLVYGVLMAMSDNLISVPVIVTVYELAKLNAPHLCDSASDSDLEDIQIITHLQEPIPENSKEIIAAEIEMQEGGIPIESIVEPGYEMEEKNEDVSDHDGIPRVRSSHIVADLVDIEVDTQTETETETESVLEEAVRQSGTFKKIAGKVVKRVLTKPTVIALFIGIFLSIAKFLQHEYMETTINYFSRTVVGLTLFGLGAVLTNFDKEDFENIGFIIINMFLRYGIAPLMAMGLAKIIGLEGDKYDIFVFLHTLPQALSTYVFSQEYEIGNKITSANVMLSTVLMIPVLAIFAAIFGWGS
ncbi:hypothetical protein PCE1_004223 [Barthelona sp. PCE]